MSQEKTVEVQVDAFADIEDAVELELAKAEKEANEQLEEILSSTEDKKKNLDATQLYLGEIGFSPLLTAEEEVLYARRALRGDERDGDVVGGGVGYRRRRGAARRAAGILRAN